MGRNRKSKKVAPEERESLEVVTLEYFNHETGEDEFMIELTKKDFDQYVIAAEELGMEIEDLVLNAARKEINDLNTQWVLPSIDDDGNIDVSKGTPVDIPST